MSKVTILPEPILLWAVDSDREGAFEDMLENQDFEPVIRAYNEAHGIKVATKDSKDPETVRSFGEVTDSTGRLLLRTKPRDFVMTRGKGGSWRNTALNALRNAANIARAKKEGEIARLDLTSLDSCRFTVYEAAESLTYRELLARDLSKA